MFLKKYKYGFQGKINFFKQLCLTVLSYGILQAKSPTRLKKCKNELLEDFVTTFPVIMSLLNKSGNATMEVKRLRNLDLEMFKAINIMNSEFMEEMFHRTTLSTRRPLNIVFYESHTTKYGK